MYLKRGWGKRNHVEFSGAGLVSDSMQLNYKILASTKKGKCAGKNSIPSKRYEG